MQKRITYLITHIETPKFLHSAVKNRSYRTNALQHVNGSRLVKTDIKKFFPSVSKDKIFQFFRWKMLCTADIAETLAKIVTFEGYLPTGTSCSPILSYWANYNLFNGLQCLCSRLNVTMTVYVDDITFSGDNASKRFLGKVKKIIEEHGYTTHKDFVCSSSSVKVVTGAAVNGKGLKLPNRRHYSVHQELKALKSCSSELVRTDILKRLRGRLNEAKQFELRFEALYGTLFGK